jgi:hypothetical protein
VKGIDRGKLQLVWSIIKMLIKKRKLVGISGGRRTAGILQPEHGEVNKALQLEIQKAKQEAREAKKKTK